MKRWKIVYEKYSKAVEKIYAVVQPYLNYSLVCDNDENEEFNILYIGIDSSLEGFKITVSEADDENQRIEFIGADETNLLYAASDFKNIYLPYAKNSSKNEPGVFFHELFTQPMKPYELITKPRIKNRGLWTWGYVIYDYKKYIDNKVCP